MTRLIPDYTVAELEKVNDIEFSQLTNDDAVALGLVALEVMKARDLNLAVDVVLGDDLVFRAKLKSTGPQNDSWLRGKAAVAVRFGESSLLVKERHLAAGTPFEELRDIDHDAYKAFGGSIPLRVSGTIVGTITMSGEPDAIDHETALEAVKRYLRASA
ncbi:MAG: hypothetical protein JWR57_22 [Mycetocola sp.]|nr:hypothetical protein [Mycetocola sp.]